MTIQWFPGHMTKAKRTIESQIKLVDMVIELRDARVPNASANPLLESLIQQKPRLLVFTKKDMADATVSSIWKKYFETQGISVLFLDANQDPIKKLILHSSQDVMKEKHDRDRRRGIRPRPIRAMILGIPNVGKSTLINRLAAKKVVQVANRPGVTQAIKWIAVDPMLQVMDTPGVLWPKFESELVGYRLALTGAIKEQILPIEKVFEFGMKYLYEHYPQILLQRYGIQLETFDLDVIYQTIVDKYGFKMGGNVVDRQRVMSMFMADLRQDKLGPISWELPDESAI